MFDAMAEAWPATRGGINWIPVAFGARRTWALALGVLGALLVDVADRALDQLGQFAARLAELGDQQVHGHYLHNVGGAAVFLARRFDCFDRVVEIVAKIVKVCHDSGSECVSES